MNKVSVSQEGLKLIACICMLIDHIGVVLVYSLCLSIYNSGNPILYNQLVYLYYATRIIGRIAFPIYCFLLVEGFHHTRNLKKYIGRLAIGMLLSEIPFDLCFSGGINWTSCSVMVTLLLGCLMMVSMEQLKGFWKIAVILPFCLLADQLGTDYGKKGIAIIAMLALTKGMPKENLLRGLLFIPLLWFGQRIHIGFFEIPMEQFALIGLIPMFLYKGTKHTRSKWIQWAFYLFYPVHLSILWILAEFIS